jgi:hypothetical protein
MLAPQLGRLPTEYNADLGLNVLSRRWPMDESLLRVIHYTLGAFKPWDWWTGWVIGPLNMDPWEVRPPAGGRGGTARRSVARRSSGQQCKTAMQRSSTA